VGIEDIRLKLDVLEHPKIRELQDIFEEMEPRLGAVAFCSWLRLVIHAARNCQDGHLKMTTRRLKSTARWTGSGDQFAGALVEVGLLEKTDEGFLLHDWQEHQEYVANTSLRVAKAKKAAAARWSGEKEGVNEEKNATSMPRASYERANSELSNAPTLTNLLPNTLTRDLDAHATSMLPDYLASTEHAPSITQSVSPETPEPKDLIRWFNENCCPPFKASKSIGRVPLAAVDRLLMFLRETHGVNMDERQEFERFMLRAVKAYQGTDSIPCSWGLLNICKEENMHKIQDGVYEPRDDAG
jgi:hypothetical protein